MKNQNIVLGGGILLTLLTLGLGWYFFLRPKKNLKTISNVEKKNLTASGLKSTESIEVDEETEEIETEETTIETEINISEKKVESSPSAVLEDDDEDDDEDDEKQAAVLKQAYDDALRLAKKFLAGNQYAKAANKYSEAIELSEKIPSASQDIITLYNNRRLFINLIYQNIITFSLFSFSFFFSFFFLFFPFFLSINYFIYL